jgi:hypothetical protein
MLSSEGQQRLAADVRQFIEAMPIAQTEKEQIAVALMHRGHQPQMKINMTR